MKINTIYKTRAEQENNDVYIYIYIYILKFELDAKKV